MYQAHRSCCHDNRNHTVPYGTSTIASKRGKRNGAVKAATVSNGVARGRREEDEKAPATAAVAVENVHNLHIRNVILQVLPNAWELFPVRACNGDGIHLAEPPKFKEAEANHSNLAVSHTIVEWGG